METAGRARRARPPGPVGRGEKVRLRCDWCELMGETGLLTLDMLEREGVLAAGGFVGVDLDAARIDGFRRARPDLKWIAGNLYERLHAPEMANVGVLNLDEYGEIGSRSAETDFPLIHGLVQRGLERFGEFALFWNQDLDSVSRRGQKRGEAACAPPRRHGGERHGFKAALPRQAELTSAMLSCRQEAKWRLMPEMSAFSGAIEVYRVQEGRPSHGEPWRVILR